MQSGRTESFPVKRKSSGSSVFKNSAYGPGFLECQMTWVGTEQASLCSKDNHDLNIMTTSGVDIIISYTRGTGSERFSDFPKFTEVLSDIVRFWISKEFVLSIFCPTLENP